MRETGPDQYIVVYLNGVPKNHELPKDASLVKRCDNVILLDIPESAKPFMEHEAKRQFSSIWGLQWRIYSLADLEQLMESLPLLALAAVLAVIPLVLFLMGAILPPRLTGKDLMLRLHVGVGILFMAGFIGLLGVTQLPFSLMPADMIFQWDHYSAQLQTAMDALAQLEEYSLHTILAQNQTAALCILAAGALLLVAMVILTFFLYKNGNKR